MIYLSTRIRGKGNELALWLLSPDRKCLDPFWLMLRDQGSVACNSYVCYIDGTTMDNILFLTHLTLILGTGASLCYVVLGILYKAKQKYYRGNFCLSVILPKSLDIFL
jgi:hypothetical protein